MRLNMIFFMILIFTVSCSNDDAGSHYFETLPIEGVNIAPVFIIGQSYEIGVTYIKPSGCYEFNDFYTENNGNQISVAVINKVSSNTNCLQATQEDEVFFVFEPSNLEPYVFSFWQGTNTNGEDIYYTVEVTVADSPDSI